MSNIKSQCTERLESWLDVPKPVVDPKLAAPFQRDVSKTQAGGKNLDLKHGQHIDYNRPHLKEDYTLSYDEWKSLCGKPKDEKARLSNVMVTMLQKMEVNAEKFVDSRGPVGEVI